VTNAIKVDHLVKEYGTLRAVDGVSFQVPRGAVFSFLGPNGAGKTTTVEVLEGLRKKTRGTVRVLGLDPWSEGRELHARIGVIPQDFHFFDKITPKEALRYYAVLFGRPVDARTMLERVQLWDKADARFDTLSGGQKQKLGLALSLVSDPEVCFLDEPTTGLDPQARRSIWEVIRALRAEGRTVFLTTHYLEEAELLSDFVAFIHQGQIIARGSPSEIIAQHGRPERFVFESDTALATYLQSRTSLRARAEGGEVEVEMREKADALRILSAVEESRIPWRSVSTRRDTLEDVFVRLVGRMDEGEIRAERPTDRARGTAAPVAGGSP
jgi:ABC-2 type transport system ATP-binding protein